MLGSQTIALPKGMTDLSMRKGSLLFLITAGTIERFAQ